MTEDTQCETMGLQATMLSNPLERFIPPSPPPALKRGGHEMSSGYPESPPKKLCLEVLKDASSRVEEALVSILEEDNKENQEEQQPKVIVQHSPLPSIYELEQMAEGGIPTPPLSDESASEDSAEEEDFGSPPPPPPAAPRPYMDQQRYSWGSSGQQLVVKRTTSNTPPSNATNNSSSSPFGFLEQNDQRIECAENGKSYLQLGTMNTPPPPLIQSKGTPYYAAPPVVVPPPPAVVPHRRRGVFPVLPRPLCDHSNCLGRRASLCYRNHRSRMLNVSLHKLHLARQNHEGSLRRSVLICNMLRHIEEEAEKEQIEQSNAAAASFNNNNNHLPPSSSEDGGLLYSSWSGNNNELSNYGSSPSNNASSHVVHHHVHHVHHPPPAAPHHHHHHVHHHSPHPPLHHNLHQQQQQPGGQASSPSSQGNTSSTASTTITTTSSNSLPAGGGHHHPFPGQTSPPYDTYEMTLKDFNSAFRSTPYGSPVHPGHAEDAGSSLLEEPINWSSVLNLSSGSSLDPLNNNNNSSNSSNSSSSSSNNSSSSYASGNSSSGSPSLSEGASGPWRATGVKYASNSAGSSSSCSLNAAVNCKSDEGFEDIGWKLSAEDVLKAFPHDEQLLLGGAP